ncbi:MAG: hypothetical protein GWP91_10260 [Rhodobacterales bacterium]|nr:hypothetical protein [Rhodobacterales bacterium]
MTLLGALRDIFIVAQFEVLRAIRTWRAMALFFLYAIAASGAAYIFTQVVLAIENGLAKQLGVPETQVAGAMLTELMSSDTFRSLLEGMVGSEAAVEHVLNVPVLAVFNLWFSFALIPFFAASASAESVSIDLRSRSLRFEALRTGRMELILGRYVGQLVLTGIASMLSIFGVFAVGMWFMRGNDPVVLMGWLFWLTLRAWFFSMPFAGVGVAASQLTTSPAWARVMAVGITAGSWLLYGFANWMSANEYPIIADLLFQILPQGWMHQLWEPTAWILPAIVCSVLGPVAVLVGFIRFAGRDL